MSAPPPPLEIDMLNTPAPTPANKMEISEPTTDYSYKMQMPTEPQQIRQPSLFTNNQNNGEFLPKHVVASPHDVGISNFSPRTLSPEAPPPTAVTNKISPQHHPYAISRRSNSEEYLNQQQMGIDYTTQRRHSSGMGINSQMPPLQAISPKPSFNKVTPVSYPIISSNPPLNTSAFTKYQPQRHEVQLPPAVLDMSSHNRTHPEFTSTPANPYHIQKPYMLPGDDLNSGAASPTKKGKKETQNFVMPSKFKVSF